MSRRSTIIAGPSAGLRDRLARLGIDDRAWQRAARRHLRQIAGDLPLFDSAFVDACVSERLLTTYQADVLNGPSPDALFLGPCVVRQVLEQTIDGPLWDATHPTSGRPLELLSVSLPSAARQATESRLHQLLRHAERDRSHAVQWPQHVSDDERGIVIAFPPVSGETIRDHVIRRGRFLPDVVASVATQLLDAVHHLETLGVCHGDVRTATVRLRGDGSVTMTRAGVRQAIVPAVTYNDQWRPDACRAIAPERIGSNQAATPASDRYAVGCLLWEMLAGRPLTPHGSALGCLRAHAEREWPSLADLAPDTPTPLLELIEALLSNDPAERPKAFSHPLRRPRFERPVATAATPLSHRHKPQRRSQRSFVQALTALLIVGVIWTGWPALQSSLRDTPSGLASWWPLGGPKQMTAAVDADDLVFTDEPTSLTNTMPATPDATGRLQLPPGDVSPTRIVWAGTLTIVGADDGSTRIRCPSAWELFADRVILERVTVVGPSAGETLIDCHSQEVRVTDCRLDAANQDAAIRWTALDTRDATGRTVTLERTRIDGQWASAVRVISDPTRVTLSDVLVVTGGTVLECDRWPRSTASLTLDHATVRGATSLMAVIDNDFTGGQLVQVDASSSLLELDGPTFVQVAMTSDGVSDRLRASFPHTVLSQPISIVDDGPVVEAMVGTLEFAGEASGPDAYSALLSSDVPLSVDHWPGIRTAPAARVE